MARPFHIDVDDDDDNDGLQQPANNFRRSSVGNGGPACGGPYRVNLQQATPRLNNEMQSFQSRHRICPQYPNRIRMNRRYSTGDMYGLHTSSCVYNHRHSIPCCHIKRAVQHSCFHVNRRLSLESSDLAPHNLASRFELPIPFLRYISVQFAPHALENTINERRRLSQCSIPEFNEQCTSFTRPEYFISFLAYQMEKTGFVLPEYLKNYVVSWKEVPQSLCYLIDTFSVSLEREMLLSVALRVTLPVDAHSFFAMLGTTDKGSLSPESVVCLYFFCGDLAIIAFHANDEEMFIDIISWTLRYLRRLNDSTSSVKNPSYKFAITACILGMIGMYVVMMNR